MWLAVRIDGWPRQSWQATIDQGFGIDELFSHMLDDVALENPNKTVHFLEVTFVVTSVSGVIQSLNLDPAMEEDAEPSLVMVEAGIERRSSRGRAIFSALNDLGSDGPGDDSFERDMNSLIEAQMRELEAFERDTNSLIEAQMREFEAFVNDLIAR
jgi:hypothetical protein